MIQLTRGFVRLRLFVSVVVVVYVWSAVCVPGAVGQYEYAVYRSVSEVEHSGYNPSVAVDTVGGEGVCCHKKPGEEQ